MQAVTLSNNLPAISEALYNQTPDTDISALRQSMAELSVVKKSLTTAEMSIFRAASGDCFEAMTEMELTKKAMPIFTFIAKDIAFNIPPEWPQVVIRFCSILKTYYPDMSFPDLVKAFELLQVGALDNYLPKDTNGYPDKKHFQQFNVDYLSRVLNAYRKERTRVIDKANMAIPRPVERVTIQERKIYRDSFLSDFIRHFLRYKYTGRFGCGSATCEMLTYQLLANLGFVEDMEVTAYDQNTTIQAAFERRDNTTAMALLRRERIKKAFDEIIKDEIQITKLVQK